MLKDTSHIKRDNKHLQRLNKDVANVLIKHPSLTVCYKKNVPISLQGRYDLRDEDGNFQGCWDIKILVPGEYPYGFPLLIETSGKIDREDPDAHIDENGVCCTELTIHEKTIARKGISLEEFIEQYVQRYFSWHLLKEQGAVELESWGHRNDGLKQFFYINLATTDHEFIRKTLQLLSSNKLPGRNENCYCGIEKKYKHCHESNIKQILVHWPQILENKDLFG